MIKQEAEKVIGILLECDGGCEYCVLHLIKLFIDKFPEYENLAKITFRDRFGKELNSLLNQLHKGHWG